MVRIYAVTWLEVAPVWTRAFDIEIYECGDESVLFNCDPTTTNELVRNLLALRNVGLKIDRLLVGVLQCKDGLIFEETKTLQAYPRLTEALSSHVRLKVASHFVAA